jgi:gentisate 1,2-dioxygenase
LERQLCDSEFQFRNPKSRNPESREEDSMKAESKTTVELDRILAKRWLSGLWKLDRAERTADPKTKVVPHLWKWDDIYGSLVLALEQIGIEQGRTERRTVRLVNPGLPDTEMTTHTMLLACQMIQPGEVAPAHRHSMAAIRFIVQGKGAYTVVNGEKIMMGEGDLILTPQWTWHDHGNEGDGPMVWLDGLDVPLIQSLQVISYEPYSREKQEVLPHQTDASRFGMTRPVPSGDESLPAPLHYRWEDTYASLQALATRESNPYDGVALEYVNPLTGGSTLPTLSCWTQLLRPGERTHTHRHNSTAIYHAFRGSGTTTINGQPFHWEKGDAFVVPLWSWHEHANRSATEEAILFSMHDIPVLKAFGLYREEGRGASAIGL